MIFDKVSTIIGIIKVRIYSIIYNKRIKIGKNIKIKKNFNIVVDKESKIIIKDQNRFKENLSIKSEHGGIIELGKNVFINQNCIITCLKHISIGDNVLIGHNFYAIDHDHDYKTNIKEFTCKEIKIGNNVWIGANVTILKGVSIGDNCIIAANTLLTKDIPSNSLVRSDNKIIITTR